VRRGLALSFLLALAACATQAPPAGPAWPSSQEPAALAIDFPNSATQQRRLLAAAHQAGDAAAVRAGLQRVAALGYAPSAATLDLLAVHVPEPEMAALRIRFESNRARVEASRLLVSVPAEYRLVEGLAWDARRSRLFAATVVDRALLVGEPLGWVIVEGVDGGSLFGLAIDERRQLLWIGSGRVDQTPQPQTAFRGLIALDLNSLVVAHRIPAPGAGSPADIAVGPDGTIYASDPASGAVYRARPEDTALSILVPAGRLGNPQGIVPTPDGRGLYVSDYERGIAIVSLADGSITRLTSDAATMLDGIDGLVAWRGGLIAIQNGVNPRRILHLTLSRDGNRITGARVLESNNAQWGEPTLGVVRGAEFLYVADAQWERYGPGGAARGEGPARPTPIRLLRPGN
jgi:hypothetical protein